MMTPDLNFTGNENERFLHVCKHDMGAMLCGPESFIWIKFIEIGVSEKYSSDRNGAVSCPRYERASCNEMVALENIYDDIGFQMRYQVVVPNKTVTCNGEEVLANYIHITFCCIEGECVS